MAQKENPNKHLRIRGDYWHYYRRVPKKFQQFDNRGTIREALGTTSLETARVRRDDLVSADDEYWTSMALAEVAERYGQAVTIDIAQQRYRAAKAHALAAGFKYKPKDRLNDESQIEEVVKRFLALSPDTKQEVQVKPFEADALLGGVPEPKITVRVC